MPNEFDTNKNQLDLFSYSESKQNQQDKRQKLASSGFTATVWTLSGVVLAACSLFEDDEGLGGESVSVLASPVQGARLYFDINGDGIVNEEDVRIQNEQYPGGFMTDGRGLATGIPAELHGRPYIALLDGAVDSITRQELEGQVSSLEDEDGNHLIASPITDLIADAIADTNLPNDAEAVVAEFTPSSVDAADILAELRNRDSYLPNTDDYSPRIVAVSKYLADNQAREVLGREDDLNTQIMEVERILGEVTTPDALIILSDDDGDSSDGFGTTFTVGEHDTYIGLVNAVSGDNTLTFRFVNANGDEMEVPGYTISPRGVISAVTTQAGQTSPVNDTQNNTNLRVRVSDGTNAEIVEVIIDANPAYELVIVQPDAPAPVVVATVEVEENDVGADMIAVIQADDTAAQAGDFVIRDAFPEDFDSLADKFEIVDAPGGSGDTFHLQLRTGEYLDHEAIPGGTFDLHVSALESGTPSNELTITVMVGNVDDISFSGTLRADLREDDTTPPSTHLIAEGQVQIANQVDANGVRAQVMLNSDPAQSGVQTLPLTHGTFTYNHETNTWTYTVNNELPVIQALLEGQATTDIVTLTITDPNNSAIMHTQSIVLNVHGANEDVHFVDANDARTTAASVGVERGNPVLADVDIFAGLTLNNANLADIQVDFAETGGDYDLFTITDAGLLTFTGTNEDVAGFGSSIPLNLEITAPTLTTATLRFALTVNVINEVDDGRAEYEVTGDVDVGQTLTVSRVQGSDDPDGVVGAVSFQWFRGEETAPTLLGTGDTYRVTQTDIDSSDSIGVFVRYTDGSGVTYTHTDGDPATTIAAFASPVSFTGPAIADRTINLDEDTSSGSTVHFAVRAESEDDAGAPVGIANYMLLDANNMPTTTYRGFTIDTTSGDITLTGSLDYEDTTADGTRIILRVRATDMNSPAETATLTLTVNVDDVNDNDPVFEQATYTTAIDETLAPGASVISVRATDDDGTTANSDVRYSIISGNTGNVFEINERTGAITVAAGADLDFETTPSYTLMIGASDGLNASGTADQTFTADDTATVTITLSDVNDEPPMVTAPAGTIRTTTGNPANTNTGYSITVTDADAEATNDFRVDSDDRRFIFERDGMTSTWNLVLLAGEAVSLGDFTLGYTATDGANTDSGTVTISAVDSSVSFDAGRGSREAPPITEGTVTASDLEVIIAASTVTAGDPAISYAITAGDPRGIFALSTDGNGNRILTLASTTTSLDHESVPNGQYQVEITATEDAVAGTGNTAIATITVIVNDVEEGDANYIVAGNVQAMATLTAQLASAGDEDPDGRVGAVTYRWFVRDAADADPTSITDTNSAITWLTDASSAADANEFTLPSTLESGGVYGVAISYLDGFADGSTPRGDATFLVELASAVEFLDADSNVLTDSTYRPDPIAENTDSLPTVTARLETATFTYAITSGNDGGIFEIGGGTGANGAISVVSGMNLDFETAEQHTLTIRVDEVGGDAFGFATVIIRVTDVNEHAPVFVTNADDNTLSTGTDEIAEDAANGARVGLFRATDADGSNNDVTYSLDDGGLGVFGIREVTGTNNWEIYVLDNTRLDFESATKSYTIEITATDSDPDTTTRKSSGAEAFTINITDVNDNDPVLSATPVWEGTLDFGVPENTGTNVHLFTVSATDADENPSLTYEIVSIDGVALASIANPIFGIDASDGRVGLAGQLDRETKASHEIVIRAVDEGGRASNEETFTVTVGDVNDNKPVIGEPVWVSDYGDNGVPEDAYTGQPLQIFTATATDRDANNGFSYEIVSVDGVTYDSSTSIFSIHAASGRVGITSALDYETAPEIMDDTGTVIGRGHEIVIVAIDNSGTGMRSEPGTITVLVANADDGAAKYEITGTVVANGMLTARLVGGLDTNEDPDGVNGSVTFRWFSESAGVRTPLGAASASAEYTLPATIPAGVVYGVWVEYTDNAGTVYQYDNSDPDNIIETAIVVRATAVQFTENVYTVSFNEATTKPVQTVGLVTVMASLNTDGNAKVDDYEFLVGGAGGTASSEDQGFTIGTNTGIINFKDSVFDFDNITDKTYTLTVQASFDSGETGIATVEITITDANDSVPVLAAVSDTKTATIAEDHQRGADVGDISFTITDADADTTNNFTSSSFTITEGTGTSAETAAKFEVVKNGDNWDLKVRATDNAGDPIALDRETDGILATGVINLDIKVNDGRPTAGDSNVISVEITVTDVNDFGPVFRNGAEHTETISEEMAVGTTVVSTNPARDGDATAANRDLTYSIVSVSGSGAGFFKLDDDQTANPGRIVLAQKLDYETAPLLPGGTTDRGYVLTLRVEDQGGLQDTQMLTVVVTDEDDTDPEFGTLDWGGVGTGTAGATARTIDENTAGTLLTIPISDVDTAGGTLAVRIVSGNSVEGGEDLFVFAKNTANTEAELSINPNRVLNYEDGTTHTLVLEVSDGTRTATETVTITVNNINEETPTFTNDPIVTWETGFELGIIPEDTDVSGGRVLVGRVAINDADNAFLDDRTFAINGAGTKFVIERNADVGTNGGTLGEGLIYLNAALDREGVGADDAEYDAVKITVTDGSLPAVTSDAFSIFIDDVNEGDPVIAVTGSPASFTERTASGNEATGVTFTISDADTGSTYTSSEIALSGDSRFDFVWDEARQSGTVVLKDTETLDHDAATNPDRAITLTLTVTDPLDASVTDTETITINVGNADDVASELGTLTWQAGTGSGVAGEEHIRTIAENQGSAPILVMSVSDPDTATASLTPTIQGGSPVDASNNPIFSFGILNNQAILSVLSSRLDYETAPNTYTLVLEVSDGTNTPAATQTVVINVGNVNEHGPAFGTELVGFGTGFANGIIPEDTAEGTVIGVVDVSDADGDVLTVTVLPDTGATQDLADKFEVVYNMAQTRYELKIKMGASFNLEGATPDPSTDFGLRLRATDGTNSVDSPADIGSLIVMRIGNVDDADPVFNDTHITWNVGALNIRGVDANTIAVFEYVVDGTTTSGAPAGRKLADLAASDPDTSGALAYSIDNGPQIGGVDIFEIGGANNDELLLKTALDYEAAEDLGGGNRGYTLTLTVSDGRMGVNPVSHEVTIRVLNADEGPAIFAPLTSSGDVTAPAVGDELTFNPTPTTADPDGNPVAPNTFTRTWYRENPDGTGLDTITNASDTYTITSADVGKIVGVIVNYIDGGGTEYLGTAGVRVELANVVASDFTADAASLRGEVHQYDLAEASGTFTYDDMASTETKAKITAADTVTYAIKTGGESVHGTAAIDSSGAWTFDVNNAHADVLALDAGDADTTNDSLTTKFTVQVSVTTDGVIETFDQDVTVTINAATKVSGTDAGDTINRSAATGYEFIQGGDLNDIITVGDHGSVVVGGYGKDQIMLGDGVDTVVHRFASLSTGGWRQDDGATIVRNFERGVDKLFLVDVDSASPVTLATFLDATKSGAATSAIEGQMLITLQIENNTELVGITFEITSSVRLDGPGGDSTDPAGTEMTIYFSEMIDLTDTDELAKFLGVGEADAGGAQGGYYDNAGGFTDFRTVPTFFSDTARQEVADTGSSDTFDVIALADLDFTIL